VTPDGVPVVTRSAVGVGVWAVAAVPKESSAPARTKTQRNRHVEAVLSLPPTQRRRRVAPSAKG
jgi:hypothetical protein